MGQLQDKVCIVTGGAGSIGLASARRFVAEGAKVMLVDLQEQQLRTAAAELPASQVAYKVADVGRATEVQTYVDTTIERWGAIDVLFSNAGNAGVIAPLAEYPEEVFDDVWRVHVKGAFLACKYGIPRMRDGGSVIITSSVAGLRGDPGVYGYITAKHAQIGLMRCAAKEAAPRRIRVNTIHPGPTRNEFQSRIEGALGAVLGRDAGEFFDELIPLRRHAAPEEIAAAVLFLASGQSSFITGSTLVVDGGMSA
ncbi:MAG TPA: SDR family NAD(P)-dependent oxidoreductase [Steroidobacteraceae bacterium]|nr:SDR family NAD(P)-dependent oxidoreductase [Steroidobacteraceae bacterium]